MGRGSGGKRLKKRNGTGARRLLFSTLLFLFVTGAVTAGVVLIETQYNYRAARDEYLELRALSPASADPAPIITNDGQPQDAPMATPPPTIDSAPTASTTPPAADSTPTASAPAPTTGTPVTAAPETYTNSGNLSAINPDYIGWIKIDGTAVDYPVVQCQDNARYMGTTFSGKGNPSGTIFMDYRCGGFGSDFAVLYGHNMRDGSMFASLHRYRQDSFRQAHPTISVTLREGGVRLYQIFAVRLVDVGDRAFSLFGQSEDNIVGYFAQHGAPKGAGQFLVLSTCTTNGSKDERLLIFASY